MRGVLPLREAAVPEDLGEGHVGARRLRKPAKLYGQMGTDEGTSQADEEKRSHRFSLVNVILFNHAAISTDIQFTITVSFYYLLCRVYTVHTA